MGSIEGLSVGEDEGSDVGLDEGCVLGKVVGEETELVESGDEASDEWKKNKNVLKCGESRMHVCMVKT